MPTRDHGTVAYHDAADWHLALRRGGAGFRKRQIHEIRHARYRP
jgi:hypothetical protein